MDNILLVAVILLSLFVLGVSIHTIIETRRRYYNDYPKRKRNK